MKSIYPRDRSHSYCLSSHPAWKLLSMENQQFRGLLLKLQDRLTDNDRKRLHFFFGDDVPRRIRDDPSLSGTLSLMESLFEQDKINEQDFTVLINAFNEIRCHDAVKLLKSHKKQNNQQPTLERLSSIMPNIVNQLIEDQDEEEDKLSMKPNYIQLENTPLTKSHFKNINPISVPGDHHSRSNSPSLAKSFWSRARINQLISLLLILVFILILSTLSGFYIHRTVRIDGLEKEVQTLQKIIQEGRTKMNETNQTINKLNNHIIDIEREQSSSLIRSGQKFGGNAPSNFDDSKISNFTCRYYLRGMVSHQGLSPSNWFQFLYSSSDSPEVFLEGAIRGYHEKDDRPTRFILDIDERVTRVEIVYRNETFQGTTSLWTTEVVAGIRLITTKGRSTPQLRNNDGLKEIEEFDGYTVGYVSGGSYLRLDQIQFHWYRTLPIDNLKQI